MKSDSVTFQMKAVVRFFPACGTIYCGVQGGSNLLYKVVLTFKSVDKILKSDHQVKAIEQYFPVVLFIMLYKVVLTFESVDEILQCDHSSESY